MAQHAIPSLGNKGQRVLDPALGARDVKLHSGRSSLFHDGRNSAKPGRARRTRRAGLPRAGEQTRPRLVGARWRRHSDS
jgi:hypothetical protein